MDRNIKAITDFIFLSDKPKKADLIIVSGTYQKQIIEKAYKVYREGFAQYIMTTGYNQEGYEQTEAEFQKKYLVSKGVPEDVIYCENESSNTKENAQFSYQLVRRLKLKYGKIILVCKSYHSRRIYMTFKRFYKRSHIIVCPAIDDRNTTPSNWYRHKTKRERVLEEVEKIGKYFLKGDLGV